MPKAPKKTAGRTTVSTVATPKGATAQTPVDNGEPKIKYHKLTITERSTASEKPPLTPQEWKDILGWMPEPEYIAQMILKEPGSKPEKWEYGEDYHCKNKAGQKVRCWKNPNNRPFEMMWCRGLIFTVLHGLWAGPHTIPGETVNGETVRIGKYDNVLSGQHQGTAVILADEELKYDRARKDYDPANPKYPFWNGHDYPFIETIIITGLSEDERVLRTVDYVKPRTAADMLYTMQLFRNNNPAERREMTKMLSAAIDTLWERTNAKGYGTHPEIVGFLERHQKLLEMIEHTFTENSPKGADGGRKISKLNLSPGVCAGLAYLMACSAGEEEDEEYGVKYRNGRPAPSEKYLEWSLWDKAVAFITRLAGAKSFEPVRHALSRLASSDPDSHTNKGMGGKAEEKLAILSKAWGVWRDYETESPGFMDNESGPPFAITKNPDGSTSYPDLQEGGSLHLKYTNLTPVKLDNKGELTGGVLMPHGRIRVSDADTPDFGGIDYYQESKSKKADTEVEEEPNEETLPEEEIKAAAERALERRREREDMLKERAAHRKGGSKG